MESKNLLLVKDFVFKSSGVLFAVDDFTADYGQVIFVNGTTDSHRTEFMMSILGFNKPQTGKIYFLGSNIYLKNHKEMLRYRRRAGYAHSQTGLLKHLTIFDNIMLPMQIRGKYTEKYMRERVLLMFEKFEINQNPYKEAWGINKLDEKKILLARAISASPDLLLIDDPTSYLENNDKPVLMNIIDNVIYEYFVDVKKTAVIVTTEDKDWTDAVVRDKVINIREIAADERKY